MFIELPLQIGCANLKTKGGGEFFKGGITKEGDVSEGDCQFLSDVAKPLKNLPAVGEYLTKPPKC